MIAKKTAMISVVAALVCFTLAAGCARQRSLVILAEDALDHEQGYASVLFWRLRVEDRTGTIQSRPRLTLLRPGAVNGGEKSFDKPGREHLSAPGAWTKESGTAVYESLLSTESKPDDYLLQDVTFPLYTDYVPNYYTGRTEEREVAFTVPVSRLVSVPPGKLVYLGTILIEFLKEEGAGYAYRVRVVQEEGDFNAAVKQFHESYPGLFKQFNRIVDRASLKVFFIENFATNKYRWTLPPADKRAHAEFINGKYLLQSNNEECHLAGIMPSFDKPQNFDVELSGMEQSKADAQGAGIMLGRDRENAYYFLLSGKGKANVELSRNGDMQAASVSWKDAATDAAGTSGNRLKIEVRGDELRYFIKDRLVGEIKNELDMKEWYLGLAVCGKQTAAFERLELIER